ncbi:MAG TPA: hypothetical protein VGH98_19295 [Gemmatimonadaceae bacterium]|jgi:hypothetical protein
MAKDDNVQSASSEPSLRDELEGFVRSIFSTTTENSAPRMIPPPQPPMLDTERPLPKSNERHDVAEQVGVMLRDLFESKDTFVISNAGVQAIIDGLLRRYRANESAMMREKLLVHWKQDVPRLRAALLEAAKDDPLVLDTGQEVSLVTTQKAQALLDRFCPQTPYLPDTRGTRDVR